MVARVGRKAQEHEGTRGSVARALGHTGTRSRAKLTVGHEALEHNDTRGRGVIAQGHTGTLGVDLGGRVRKPKPRATGEVDELAWSRAQQLAIVEVAREYHI